MSDETPEEPVVFTPRILSPRFKVRVLRCPDCDGPHNHFWYSSKVPAPSCEERRRARRP